jgi:hypothetical protein
MILEAVMRFVAFLRPTGINVLLRQFLRIPQQPGKQQR